jgi:hypothetical protein
MQRQRENPVVRAVAVDAVGNRIPEREVALASRADDELDHPVGRICGRVGPLRREPFVVVLMSVEHDLGAHVVEVAPERPVARIRAVRGSGREARLVPVSERAGVGVLGQVVREPLLLRRANAVRDLGVECDQMPGPDVVGVVEIAAVERRAEVVPVALCVGRVVLVVARHRLGRRLEGAPGRVVVAGVVGERPAVIGVVAQRELHARRDRADQVARVGLAAVGSCDVARSCDDRIAAGPCGSADETRRAYRHAGEDRRGEEQRRQAPSHAGWSV